MTVFLAGLGGIRSPELPSGASGFSFDEPAALRRMQTTVKQECVREKNPRTLDEAKRWVGEYIKHYNTARLHSAIGYVTPTDMLEGRQAAIHAARNQKLKPRENNADRIGGHNN